MFILFLLLHFAAIIALIINGIKYIIKKCNHLDTTNSKKSILISAAVWIIALFLMVLTSSHPDNAENKTSERNAQENQSEQIDVVLNDGDNAGNEINESATQDNTVINEKVIEHDDDIFERSSISDSYEMYPIQCDPQIIIDEYEQNYGMNVRMLHHKLTYNDEGFVYLDTMYFDVAKDVGTVRFIFPMVVNYIYGRNADEWIYLGIGNGIDTDRSDSVLLDFSGLEGRHIQFSRDTSDNLLDEITGLEYSDAQDDSFAFCGTFHDINTEGMIGNYGITSCKVFTDKKPYIEGFFTVNNSKIHDEPYKFYVNLLDLGGSAQDNRFIVGISVSKDHINDSNANEIRKKSVNTNVMLGEYLKDGEVSEADLYPDVLIDDSEYEKKISGEIYGDRTNGSFIIPDSNTRLISEYDLQGLSEWECRIARNEIYARHGRRFKDAEMQSYFDSLDWYHGTIEPDSFTENMLSDIEKANRDLIAAYEKQNSFYVEVSASDGGVNMRSGPGADYDIVESMIPNGTVLEVYGVETNEANSKEWYLIKYNGKTGYVAASQVTCK